MNNHQMFKEKNKPLRVLLIEDNLNDTLYEKSILEDYKLIKFEVIHVISVKDSLELIGKIFFDVILLDLRLPNGAGLEVFNSIHNKCKSIPIVIVSEYKSHAIEAVKNGAQDFLIKPVNDSQLVIAINYAIERKKLEEKNKKNYNLLLNLFNNMKEMIYISDPDTYEIVFMNKSIKKVFGCSYEDNCDILFGKDYILNTKYYNDKIFGSNMRNTFVYDMKLKDNRWYKHTIQSIQWNNKILKYTMLLDITERKLKEERFFLFVNKKLDDFNIKVKALSLHSQKQISRLEQITKPISLSI